MNQFILVVFIYCFNYFFGFSQVHQQFSSNATRADTLKNGETYILASVDKSDKLLIITNNSRKIFIPKDSGQVGFDKIVISKDGKSIGWLALYDNVATSYPIPLELKIYTRDVMHKFTGVGLPIWQWHFTANSKQVAYEQETVHGGWGIHYELREIATEQLIEMYEPEYGENNQPLKVQKNVPKWVEELNNKQ